MTYFIPTKPITRDSKMNVRSNGIDKVEKDIDMRIDEDNFNFGNISQKYTPDIKVKRCMPANER